MQNEIEQSNLSVVENAGGLENAEKIKLKDVSFDNVRGNIKNIPMNLKNLEQPVVDNVVPFVNVKEQEVENSFNDVEAEKSAPIAIDGPTIETADSIIFLPDEFTATEFGYKPINVSNKMYACIMTKHDKLIDMLNVPIKKDESPMITVSDGYTDEIINQSSQENYEIENQPQQENVVEDSSEFTYSEIKDENMPVPEVNVSEYGEPVIGNNEEIDENDIVVENEQPVIEDGFKTVDVEEYTVDANVSSDEKFDLNQYQEPQAVSEESKQQFETPTEEPVVETSVEENPAMTIIDQLAPDKQKEIEEYTLDISNIVARVNAIPKVDSFGKQDEVVDKDDKGVSVEEGINKNDNTFEKKVVLFTELSQNVANILKEQEKKQIDTKTGKKQGNFIQITNIYEPEENKSEKGLAV